MAEKQISITSENLGKGNDETIELTTMPSSQADRPENQAEVGGKASPDVEGSGTPVEQPDAIIIMPQEEDAEDKSAENNSQPPSLVGSNKSETGKC